MGLGVRGLSLGTHYVGLVDLSIKQLRVMVPLHPEGTYPK